MKNFYEQIIENFNHKELLNENVNNNSDFFYKPTFILSLPRVGSTFLQQILLSVAKIGYVSNLIGCFWNKPEIGSSLHSKFFFDSYISNFNSNYGNTNGIFEPHEWGFFWRKWLDIPSNTLYYNPKSKINWTKLRSKLIVIEKILNKPLFFNTPYVNNYFKEINSNITKCNIIFLFRNPFSICNSILNARNLRYNSLSVFFGAKPKDYLLVKKISNPIEQVIAQVFYIYNDLLYLRSSLKKRSYITIKYEDIINEFDLTTKAILNFTNSDHDKYLKNRDVIPSFNNRNKIKFFDCKYKKEFNLIFQKYFKNFNYDDL